LATNGASITVDGESSSAGSFGVILAVANQAIISSDTGAISISGTSSAGTGIYTQNNTSISSSNGGNITLTGTSTGGGGVGLNLTNGSVSTSGQVQLNGSAVTNTGVINAATVSGGVVTVVGSASGTGASAGGVSNSGIITATAGNVHITGTASVGTASGIFSSGAIASNTGDVTLSGSSALSSGVAIQAVVTAQNNVNISGTSSDTASTSQGVVIQNAVKATSGDITVTGNTNSNVQRAIAITANGANNGSLQTVASGKNININADTLLINTPSSVDSGAAGTVTLKTTTNGGAISLGGADTMSSTASSRVLGIDQGELGTIKAAKLVIGDTTTGGNITVGANVTTADATGNVYLKTAGNVSIANNLTVGSTGGKSLSIEASGANSTISGSGIVTANELKINAANATVAMASAANQVNTISANAKSLAFQNGKALSVGTVFSGSADQQSGITTSGATSLSGATNSTVTQTAAINADGLELLGSADFTLNNASNAINSLAANAKSVALTNSKSFSIDTVNSTQGVTTTGTTTLTTTSGDLTLKKNITATGSTVSIDVAGAITREAGTIGADLLNLKAGTTIGSSAKRIQTSVNKLSLNSSGDQYVTDADSVIVSALTTGTGSIDINTASGASDGMLQVDTVNGIVGVSAKGSVNLVGATSVSNKQGVRVNQNVTSTGGGDISITGTHTGTGAGLNLGVYLTSDVGGGGAGAVNITGSALTSTGIYVTGGKISSSKKISLVGSGVIGVNFTGGTGVASLAGGADFLNTDAIYIKGTGTSISDVLLRTPIQNSSKGGNTTIQGAATAGVWLDTGSSITNDASAGSINITAGNGTSTGGGGITTIKGVTITQHANADVVMTTDGLGSLQPAKIIKDGLGAGNIILAAGKLISKGTSSGGNIAPVATNTITNLGTGVTRIYSGSTSGTTALSVLDSSLTNLYLSQVGANVQNADTNVAFGAQLSPTTPIQVFFREKISTLGSGALEGASLTKTYGDGSTQNSQVTNLFAEMATALKSKNSGSLSIAKNAATLNIDKTVLVDDLVSASLNSAAYSSSGFLNANSSGYSYDTFIGSKYGASLAPNQAAKVFVNQKALSVGGVNLQSKTYDGTDTAFFAGTASIGTVSAGSSTSNDGKIIGGDNVAVSTTVNATYETKNVAGVDANGNNNVTISGVLVKANAAGTDDSKNYTWAKVDGKGSITAKEVSYSGLGVVDKAYDGTTAAVLNGAATTSNVAVGSSLANDQKLIAGDNVVLAGTAVGTYASANVVGTNGNGSNTVAVSGLSLAKADAAGSNDTLNYKLVQRTLSADNTIKPADLVITANDDAKFVTQADSVGYAGVKFTGLGNTGTGFVNGENQSVFTGQLTVTRNNVAVNSAGSYTGALEASGYTSSNYKIKYVKGDYYIVPADQVLVKTASSNITYGADPVYNTTAQYLDSNSNTIVTLARSGVNGNYTFSDGVGGELYVSLAPYLNGFAAPASNSGKLNVGTYDIRDPNAFTNGTSNFSGAPIFAGTLRVDKKDVFLNSISASNKTYDGKNSASVSSDAISGTVGNEKLKVSGAGSFDSKNAGVDKTVTVNDVASLDKLNGDNGGDWSNYNLVTSGQMTTKANIDAKEITLVAGNVSKTYNGSNDYVTQQSDLNTLTNQLVSGDKVTSASISYTDKNAGAGNKTANLNSANIDDGNNGNNYIVTLSGNNTSTITPKALTLTLGNVSKTYDGTTGYTTQQADLDVLSNQLIAGDEVVGASISYLNKDAGTNNKNVNLDSVIVSDGQGGNNYTITRAGNSTSTVLKADLTLTGNRSYDGTTTVAGGTLTAVGVRGESFSINGIGDSSNLDSKNVGTVKLTTLNGLSLGTGNAGADADNYNVISASSSSYTINKADVTVTAQAVTKTYDGTTNATGQGQVGTLAGAGAGEVVNSAGTQAFTDKNAGVGTKTVKASGVTIKDAANQDVTGNYNIAYVDHTASTINKADVILKAGTDVKNYDGTTNSSALVNVVNKAAPDTVVANQSFTDKNPNGVNGSTLQVNVGYRIIDAGGLDMSGNYNVTTQTAKGTINQSSANQTKSDSQSSRPNMLPPPPVLMPDANSMQSRKSFNVVAAQKEITPEVDSEHGCSATNLEACECLPSLVAEVEICLPVNRNIKAAYKKPDGSL
jgi:trimeric autotransporter adhesin